jgi:hypothetical protein
MDSEVAILDHDLGPQLGVEGLAVDQPALGLDQQAQHIERLARDRQTLAVPRHASLGRVEDEGAERVQRDLISALTFF